MRYGSEGGAELGVASQVLLFDLSEEAPPVDEERHGGDESQHGENRRSWRLAAGLGQDAPEPETHREKDRDRDEENVEVFDSHSERHGRGSAGITCRR